MNEHEEAARTRKAIILVDQLRRHLPNTSLDELAVVAERMPDAQWKDVASLAHVNPPSRGTVRIICTILRTQHRNDIEITKNKNRPGMVMADANIFKGLT